jgi:4'-phosphopantetheinyl transferase
MHLWTGYTDEQSQSDLEVILSIDEQKRAQRFHHISDSREYVFAHALLRLALSHHLSVSASEWQFDRDRNGKPVIASPELSPSVQFSLSHTGGLVACLITLSAEAGVDVEKVEYTDDLPLVARNLSPAEQSVMSTLSSKAWTEQFFGYWTLKEAIGKARGFGLSLLLNGISFELNADGWASADFSRDDDDPSMWNFWREHLISQHALAVAVKRDFDGRCEIIRRTVKFDRAGIVLLAQAHHTEPRQRQKSK